MPLQNMNTMLRQAREGGYAVGAFNILDLNSTRAVIGAAVELKAPVILQTSAKTVVFWGASVLARWVESLAAECPVPVALHLDHCKDLELIRQCIQSGWTSVMIDASSRPFEENLSLTHRVVEMARPAGVSVEAELGEIGGVEDDNSVADDQARLADPGKAQAFCAQVQIDCLAPAIGTAHGIYKGEPRIAFDRIAEISRRIEIPLALHGGTGLSEEVFKKCIRLGCAKVNISTQLKHTFIDSFIAYHASNPDQYEPLKVLGCQYERLKQDAKTLIELFGGAERG